MFLLMLGEFLASISSYIFFVSFFVVVLVVALSCVTCFFSLAALKIFSLPLILVHLINMCLGVFLLGFILYGTLCFLDLSE